MKNSFCLVSFSFLLSLLLAKVYVNAPTNIQATAFVGFTKEKAMAMADAERAGLCKSVNALGDETIKTLKGCSTEMNATVTIATGLCGNATFYNATKTAGNTTVANQTPLCTAAIAGVGGRVLVREGARALDCHRRIAACANYRRIDPNVHKQICL